MAHTATNSLAKSVFSIQSVTVEIPRENSSNGQRRLVHIARMGGDFLTCMEMPVSGARTSMTRGTIRSLQSALPLILRVLAHPATVDHYEVAPGTVVRTNAVPRHGLESHRMSAEIFLVFDWQGRCSWPTPSNRNPLDDVACHAAFAAVVKLCRSWISVACQVLDVRQRDALLQQVSDRGHAK